MGTRLERLLLVSAAFLLFYSCGLYHHEWEERVGFFLLFLWAFVKPTWTIERRGVDYGARGWVYPPWKL